MSVIYKYPFSASSGVLEVPFGDDDQVVLTGTDPATGNAITVWVQHDSIPIPGSHRSRMFQVFGTGHIIPVVGWVHVGSFINTPFVWHIFAEEVW
jgi:hypothetical protein